MDVENQRRGQISNSIHKKKNPWLNLNYFLTRFRDETGLLIPGMSDLDLNEVKLPQNRTVLGLFKNFFFFCKFWFNELEMY